MCQQNKMIIDSENVLDCFLRFVYTKHNLMNNNATCESKSHHHDLYYRDNGACNHFVVFIFSLSSFCERHQDRSAEVFTDVPCTWYTPKRITLPSEITSIVTIIRVDQSCPPPLVPTLEIITPEFHLVDK